MGARGKVSLMEMLSYLIVLVLLVLGILVIHGTITKNRWGINFKRVICPGCKEVMPRIRKPASGNQAMWGGMTCPKCGTEMDKWGRKISP